jgi:hypothetical protein
MASRGEPQRPFIGAYRARAKPAAIRYSILYETNFLNLHEPS